MNWQGRVESQGCTGKESLPTGAVGGTLLEDISKICGPRHLGREQGQN